jgi:hypothetical protein
MTVVEKKPTNGYPEGNSAYKYYKEERVVDNCGKSASISDDPLSRSSSYN